MTIKSNEITPQPAPLGRLRLLLCPPLPERSQDFDQIKQFIEASIRPCLPAHEKKIGLTGSSPQFAEDLSEAILLCILVNKSPPERLSEIHKGLLSISKDVQSAADILQRLDVALQRNTRIYPGVLRRYSALGKQTSELIALSRLARAHSDALPPDEGGQQGMVAFRILGADLRRHDWTRRKGDVELR